MYQHFTQEERYEIYEKLSEGFTKAEIALLMGKHVSSVYRELKRNKGQRGYRPRQAHQKAQERHQQKPRRIKFTERMQAEVEAGLKQDHSPEQIAGRAKRERRAMVSHERIYQYIWEDKRKGGTLYRHLRRSSKKYRKRYGSKEGRGRVADKISLDERPMEVETRSEIGHWEIDTVIGKNHEGAVVTIVERRSRFTVIGSLVGKHAEPCAQKTIQVLEPFASKVMSITADNGKEFAKFQHIAESLGASFFFAHPYHSWERGTNENTNGLIRQYLPKSMSFENITQEDCCMIMQKLNNRPRKVLDFQTPAEVFFAHFT